MIFMVIIKKLQNGRKNSLFSQFRHFGSKTGEDRTVAHQVCEYFSIFSTLGRDRGKWGYLGSPLQKYVAYKFYDSK